MGDTVELWIVDEPTGETVLMIKERRRCPVGYVPLDDEGVCPVDELNWTVWD